MTANIDNMFMLLLLISTFFVLINISTFNFNDSFAFKPNTHIYAANTAIQPILSGSNMVYIDDKQYPVDSRIADAIRSYPDYYRGGVVGPDAFPDIYVGQSFIHPDSRCNNGEKTRINCEWGDGFSFSYQWLRHVYDSGWDYYNQRNGDEEGKKALAFTYGFLTHAAGDMWGHTLVNKFAQGIFPSIGEILQDPSNLGHATRHIIAEGYIGKHTPDTDLTINSPSNFIYRTFIDSNFADSRGKTAMSLGNGEIFKYFFELQDRLSQEIIQLDNRISQVRDELFTCPIDPNCSTFELGKELVILEAKRVYVQEWIRDIQDGLEAWPVMSQNIAYNLFTNTAENHMDVASDVVRQFITDHLLSMMGAPDAVGPPIDAILDFTQWLERLLGEVVQPLKDLRNYVILHTTGIDIEAVKEFYSSPENYINTPAAVTINGKEYNIGFSPDTSSKLDKLMGIEDGVSNPNAKFPESFLDEFGGFAAVRNTITMTKLLLLDTSTINSMLKDHGVEILYLYHDETNGFGASNVMLESIRSLDANNQWRKFSAMDGDLNEAGNPKQHGEGMYFWKTCGTRDKVFRDLFIDWEHKYSVPQPPDPFNKPFPDKKEPCLNFIPTT